MHHQIEACFDYDHSLIRTVYSRVAYYRAVAPTTTPMSERMEHPTDGKVVVGGTNRLRSTVNNESCESEFSLPSRNCPPSPVGVFDQHST